MSTVTVAHIVLGLRVGGLERVVVNLARGFKDSRYKMMVICLEEGGLFEEEIAQLGVPVHVLGKKTGRDWDAICKLARLLRDNEVTVVHTHNPVPHFHGVAAALLAKVPVRVHSKHGRNYPNDWKKVLLNRMLSWFTDAIVPVSDNTRDVALQIEKVNPHKVQRIWNGIDTELYKPNAQLSTLNAHPPLIGTVARLSPEKDQKTMLAAFKLVLERWGKLPACPASATGETPRLIVAGDGSCMDELRNEASRLGISTQVDFFGERSDVASLLPHFDLFTLSSVTEGISMTILEAMACGVPIVATDVGGNGEIVNPPECGLLVPPHDSQALAEAYLTLLRDPARRVAMGASGRVRVLQHFSLERMVEQYSNLYSTLIEKKLKTPHGHS